MERISRCRPEARDVTAVFERTIFRLTCVPPRIIRSIMTALKSRWCWRRDLAGFRGLSERERAGFLLVLEWFENFRLRHGMEAGRDAAKAFWREEVVREGRPREEWQLDQWSDAIGWYLKWLDSCAEAGADHRSLPERLRAAVVAYLEVLLLEIRDEAARRVRDGGVHGNGASGAAKGRVLGRRGVKHRNEAQAEGECREKCACHSHD